MKYAYIVVNYVTVISPTHLLCASKRTLLQISAVLFFSFFFSIVEASDLPSDIRFTHIISSKEDVVGEILDLHQDKFGFIWLGGKDGLARFDGYDYEIFRLDLNNPHSISNNVVHAIEEDDEGNLFIGTNKGLNYFIRESKTFIRYDHDPNNKSSLDHQRIISLYKEGNTLWIGTDIGLNAFDISARTFTRYPQNEQQSKLESRYVLGMDSDGDTLYISSGWGFKVWDRLTGAIDVYGAPGAKLPEGMPDGQVRTLLVARNKKVWVGTLSGLTLFDPVTKSFQLYPDAQYSLNGKSSEIWDIHEDSEGEIWIGTDGVGLLRLDQEKGEFINYSKNLQDHHSISSNVVHTILEDKVGDIWVGFYPAGVDVIHRDSAVFQTFRNNTNDDRSISWDGVTSIIEDRYENLWIGTDGGGLNYYDAKNKTYDFFWVEPNDSNSLKSHAIMTIMEDTNGYIWLGYWNEGVSRYDPNTGKFLHFDVNRNDPNYLNAPDVFSIIEDRSGDIWVGSLGGGLAKFDSERELLVEFKYKQEIEGIAENDDRVWSMVEDQRLNLWLGTSAGLVRVDRETQTSEVFRHDEQNSTSISNNFIVSLREDSKGRLWIGTHGGGLNRFNPGNQSFTSIGVEEGFASDIIYQIIEDNQGMLWLSTKKGITSYDPNTNKFRNFNIISGEQSSQFQYGSGTKLRNGDIVFGGISGYVRFNPKLVSINKHVPEVVLTDIKVANSNIEIGGEENIIDKNIYIEDTLHFNYKQNIFTLYYAALNFRNPNNNQYSYMLEGFDQNWFQVGNVRSATYTNLDPGVYKFRVRGSNDNDVWNDQGVSINIIVSPAPWRTWWAYLIYALAIMSGVTWYVYTQRKMIGYQKSMVKSLSEVNKIKDQFIASTSHELRTPLFGIVGLAESLMQDAKNKLSGSEFKSLELIVSSAKRLVIQVNDILDFSSIKKNSLSVNIKAYKLCEITEMVVGILLPTITNDNVKLINKVQKKLPAVAADESRLQQILINLISNALRHTTEGYVSVDAEVRDGEFIISVEDTGSGIAEENFDELFQEFKQLDDVNTRKQGGTGLGLSITKRLVELQKGKIWVESTVGKGSKFLFSMPLSKDRPISISVSESAVTRVQSFVRTSDPDTQDSGMLADSFGDESYNILIVDDEAVNRIVLKGFMKKMNFKIFEAENGEKALEFFSKGQHVDLIILDVMMPGLSGFEVCEKIRTYKTLCELPILFITARGQMDDLTKGFSVGGSDFLPKPVDRQELVARVSLHLKMLELNRNLAAQTKAS